MKKLLVFLSFVVFSQQALAVENCQLVDRLTFVSTAEEFVGETIEIKKRNGEVLRGNFVELTGSINTMIGQRMLAVKVMEGYEVYVQYANVSEIKVVSAENFRDAVGNNVPPIAEPIAPPRRPGGIAEPIAPPRRPGGIAEPIAPSRPGGIPEPISTVPSRPNPVTPRPHVGDGFPQTISPRLFQSEWRLYANQTIEIVVGNQSMPVVVGRVTSNNRLLFYDGTGELRRVRLDQLTEIRTGRMNI